MKILLTGFEPFGGSQVNPSEQVVRRIAAAPPLDADLRTLVLPVVYYRAADLLREALDLHRPDLWLGIGQGNVAGLSVESVGLNLNHARIPDNQGNAPQDEPAAPGRPAAYFATVPARELVTHLSTKGIPSRLSVSAGTFICNHVLFAALEHTASAGLDTRCGFIHVPLLPEQAALEPGELRPSMSLDYLDPPFALP
ncbi:MAG: pyroglutamyl-peptidase I [Dehalococcoidia bacterium]|nr:pyroglutamyl-peptidase I [Dehalococcoidia bacterium]